MSPRTGRWQRFILATLADRTHFGLATTACDWLGRQLSPSEYAALHRAAHSLARRGACQVALIGDEDEEPLRAMTYVARPGFTVNGTPFSELSVKSVKRETGSSLKGSLREIARVLNVSHTTVWRDRHRAERQPPAEL